MHILNIWDGNTSSKHLFLKEFVTNSTARKSELLRYLLYFRVQIDEEYLNLNKDLNLVRRTVKYGSLN